jgi:hypothetical protein
MWIKTRYPALLLALGLAAVGCDDDPAPSTGDKDASTDTPDASSDKADSGAADSGTADSGSSTGKPVYAMMTQVYSTDDRTVYLSLSDTLDLEEVDLKKAREFPGVANFGAVGGRILVSSGQEATVTAFEVDEELRWKEQKVVDFSNYPLPDGDYANFFHQYIVNDHTAYLPFEVTKRIIWDPTDMKILRVDEESSLEDKLKKGNLELGSGGNRNGIRFKGPVMQPFGYVDKDYLDYGTESYAAVYDEETHKEAKVIELPCAGAAMTTQDEDGNVYFGTWSYLGLRKLYDIGPAPCVARVKADLTLDEGFTTDFTDLTGGLYVNNFRYIGKGRAIGNVLDHNMLNADFEKEFDPDVDEAAWKSGKHWSFWIFDLKANKAWPVEGIENDVGSGAQFAVLDGRTFVFLPFDDWSKTAVYELDADGKAEKRFEVEGDVFKWVRVR